RLGVDIAREPEMDGRPRPCRLDDEPRLRLPEGQAEVPLGERPVRVEVDRETLARVEELDEQVRPRAVARDVVGPGEGLRRVRDGVTEQAAVRKRAQAEA